MINTTIDILVMIMILNVIFDIFIGVIFVNLMVMYFLIESAVLCLAPPAKKFVSSLSACVAMCHTRFQSHSRSPMTSATMSSSSPKMRRY